MTSRKHTRVPSYDRLDLFYFRSFDFWREIQTYFTFSASQSKPQASSAPREVKNEPSRERPISQASSNSSGTQGYRGMMSGPPPPPPAPPEENNWGQPPPPNNAGPPPDNWGGGPMGRPPMGGSNNEGPWGSQPPGRWNNTGPFGGYGQQDGYYGPDGGHGGFY